MKNHSVARIVVGMLSFGSLIPGAALSSPLALSEAPLTVSTSVQPNVMLMLDNSGSMQNIVPDTPYNPNTTYLASCPSENRVSASTQLETRIVDGSPRIRIGSDNYRFGIAAGRRCFASNTDYMAKLYADGSNGGSTSSYLPAQYTGNYLNWYFDTANDPTGCSNTWSSGRKPCSQSRMMIAKKAGKNLIDTMSAGMRVGLSSYNSGDGGSLKEVVGNLTTSKKTTLKSKIDGLAASGATPLAETLSDIGRYFATGYTGALTLHPGRPNQSTATVSQVFNNHSFENDSDQSIVAPIEYSCQKSFAVLLTDGRPQQDQDISTYLRDYDGDCAGASPPCQTHDRKPDQEYESAGSDYLDDVAQALYEMDLRPDLDDPPGAKNNIRTHLISFADDQAINDPLMQSTATQGGGKFLVAGNEAELATAFQAALASILEQSGSSSSATANAGFIGADTKVYQARFNSGDWSGQLLAFAIEDDYAKANYGRVLTSGSGPGGALWDAGSKLPAWSSRNIFTVKNGDGIPFRWSELSTAAEPSTEGNQQGALGSSAVLEYLRGNDALELRNGGTFRNRTVKLGDIVNSAPVFVGAPRFRYPDSLESAAYSTFVTNKKNRTKMIYVGANDGMLHGFNADTGIEQMAYVPGPVYGRLSELPSTTYSHRYYVDGSPTVIDAFIGSAWKSVLVGGLNRGGQGIYALDVTDPASFSETAANAAKLVLWEFTHLNDADLGYTYSRPAIVRLKTGKWAAVFGNGYNNTEADGRASITGNAVLFIVDLETGALLRKIDTAVGTAQDPKGTGRPNGLATVAPADVDGDHIIEAIYAGDFFGNLWKFDLSSDTAAKWDVAFKQGSTPKPLFTACAANACTTGSSSNRQPITVRPEIGKHPTGSGVIVYFGTGQYLETGDNNGAAGGKQTFYAISDKDATTVGGRSSLAQQSILQEGAYRVTTKNAVDWETKGGWFIDLLPPSNTLQGERQVTDPLLRNNRIIFTTVIPANDPCIPGGPSWLMEFDAGSGSRLAYSPFDVNADSKFSTGDFLSISDTQKAPPSGMKLDGGAAATPSVMAGKGGQERKYISNSAGLETIIENSGPWDTGRQTWRQLGR
ncbi:pilus assembly protein [Aromatoleum anaerobium]|uniref:PilY1 beta-propeller domain-containing protein n=1 Tax=Aromatoleum anaerobium TaxID=182180 RepID=A0ABX1PP75_9RHOO|nr:PilC/PilY family type IV pilus protein [Aromatoleum anaerobium]MCK0506288.1 hypothetical protein [Aromatoleum anaerobium]